MYKIYSRPRIKIPKIKLNQRRKKNMKMKKIALIMIILIIAICVEKLILGAVLPVFETLCENRAKSIATIISNEQATNVMKKYSYNEMFQIEKDNNGNVTMIKSNIILINEIISDVAVKIQEGIDKRGKENVKIALGSFTGFSLVAGKGPLIPITISSAGGVETDLKSEFISQGINQTLHRVYLQVDCEVNILTPFESISKKISNQVLLVENVIVGNIPNTYYNLEGFTEKRDVMEIIE